MKISFIIQDLFQQGAEYITALLIRGFVNKGYDVDLVVSKVHSDRLASGDKPFEIPQECNLITLPNRKARKNLFALRKYLSHTDAHSAIVMCPHYSQAVAIAALGLRHCPQLVYVEHGLRNGGFGPKFPSRRWLWMVIRRHSFDKVCGVSKFTTRDTEIEFGIKPGAGFAVYNPVIDDVFRRKIKEPTQHPWLTNKEMPTFVAAGAHCDVKRHCVLFEAFKKLNEATPARLILFGKGVLTEEYKKWIAENNMEHFISLPGQTYNLPAELKSADGFLISSYEESFSIVLIEAMASNIPVISTDCPYGPPELLNHGEYGRLVPINDSNSMAQAIIEQIQNPRRPAPPHVWQKFTIENIVARYEEALGIN